MEHARRLIQYWLPVLIWMGVIAWGSGDALSSQHTSRLIVPMVRWLLPRLSEPAIERVHATIRKAGHVSEYAILAVLFWRARRKTGPGQRAMWGSSDAGLAFAFAVVYAATDELHQSFVSSRTGQFTDVLWDAAGAAVGLVLAGAWRRGRGGKSEAA